MITLLAPEAFPGTVDVGEASEPASVVVRGEAYRHLFRARRLAVGDVVRLADGRGAARWARVAEVDRRSARLEPGGAAPANEPTARVGLVVAALKPQRAGWLVEKATELGVYSIRFVSSARAPRNYGPSTLERLRRLVAAAVEQCHRARTPEVSGVHAWGEIGDLLAPWPERWLLDQDGDFGRPGPTVRSATLVVGPEGGFEDGEKEELAALGCRRLSLGPRVLRVETAATVAGALLLLPGARTDAGPDPERPSEV